jgi:hypothetical protein
MLINSIKQHRNQLMQTVNQYFREKGESINEEKGDRLIC